MKSLILILGGAVVTLQLLEIEIDLMIESNLWICFSFIITITVYILLLKYSFNEVMQNTFDIRGTNFPVPTSHFAI